VTEVVRVNGGVVGVGIGDGSRVELAEVHDDF
jgi:hypothetical protein